MTKLLLILGLIALATSAAAVGCSPASADPAPTSQVAPPGNPVSERLLVIETRLETIDSIGRYAVVPLIIAMVALFLWTLRGAESRITDEIRKVAGNVKETRDELHKVEVNYVPRLNFEQELGSVHRRMDGIASQVHG